jgi:hypothetical protein
MKKSALFLIISIITIIFLFSTAALCSMCGLSLVSDAEKASSQDNDSEGSSGSGKSGDSKTKSSSSSSSSDSKEKSENKSSDKKSQNSPPEIISLKISDDKLYTNLIYQITSDVRDADNDTISYTWSADGGTFDNTKAAAVMWTAPGFPETYHIKLEVNDGKGGSDSDTKTIRVEEIGKDNKIPQDNPPVITRVVIESNGTICNNNTYTVWCYTDLPEGVVGFNFHANGGSLRDQNLNSIVWETPSTPGDYLIIVTITDKNGNTDRWEEDVKVELCVV